jgi:hypothetical protein
VIVLDAEGATEDRDDAEVDRFLLAVASFTVRPGDKRRRPTTEEEVFEDPSALWRWISSRAHADVSTWLVAHGLHYDYTVTAAHRELRRLGWRFVDGSMRRGARWVRWRCGRRSLVLVDLYNYLPLPLAEIGKAIGIPKAGTGNPRDGSRRYWLRRCRRDVEIARAAFLRLLDWWDDRHLGRFGFTSAGCAWAAWRHRYMEPRSVLIHRDPEARELERRALYGGRREIYRQGRLPEGLWVDLDYVAHYLMTAAEVPVPVKLGRVEHHVREDVLDHLPENAGIIAEVTVEVDEPVAPVRDPVRGIVYPVGRFRTVLCQPELELVREHGRIVAWHRVALYTLRPVLDPWCEWLVGALYGDGAERDPLVRILLKDWARSLIGKFGQRRPEPRPEPDDDGVVELPEIEVTPETIPRELPWLEAPPLDPCRGEDAENAAPAITAWIHSAARVTLWRAIETAGRADVAMADTDGILVRAHPGNLERLAELDPNIDPAAPSVHAAIPDAERQRPRPSVKERRRARRPKVAEPIGERPVPGRMQVKGKYGVVELIRPADYVLDGREVIKGVPLERRKLGERRYLALYWPGIPWQLVHGRPGTYVRPRVEITLRTHYDRGWVLYDGRVVPLEAEVVRGRTRIVPWERTRYAAVGAQLADEDQARRIAEADRAPP